MSNSLSDMSLIENYIYFYHLDKCCILPLFPEQVNETNSATFGQTPILGRSAPIITYSSSGPRTASFNFTLHREMLTDINITNKTFVDDIEPYEAVEELIKMLEASTYPKYTAATKAVNPPIIAVRLGNTIYIKGVVGSINHTYKKPIVEYRNRNGVNEQHYSICDINFSVTEYDPYDAEQVKTLGSFRGLNSRVEKENFNRGE